MAAPEDSTNLTLVKVGRSGKVKIASAEGRKDEDAAAFKRLMAKLQEESVPGGYLHGRGALDHDDVLYLKEQKAAEQDAERMREHNEKRAFLAFKLAAQQADAELSRPIVVEPKTRTGIRQQSLLKNLVEVKPKKPKISALDNQLLRKSSSLSSQGTSEDLLSPRGDKPVAASIDRQASNGSNKVEEVAEKKEFQRQTSGVELLGLAYGGSDEDEE